MRIAVTGLKGQVVSALIEAGNTQGFEVIALGRPDLDLAEPATVRRAIAAARPDFVVSAAAYTAVDKAESEPDVAHAINGAGAGAVAAAAAEIGVPIVHLSTDYVFDGSKTTPYVETDPTNPLGVYGASKLAGERLVAAATDNHAIVRVAWVYSPFGANFVRTMLRLAETRDELGVVADQHGGPTSAHDIAQALLTIGDRLVRDPAPELRGRFHLPPAGEATWAAFASAIFAGATARGRKGAVVRAITTADYPTPAKRPANSRLDGAHMSAIHGIVLPHWQESLEVCLGRLCQPQA
jgi:dTDP-4-dehydrorhamnose reductase